MDVVYNHLGPEGNYLGEFGHYFTDRYHTPWGKAINFDCQDSDEVRRFFVENALFWIDEYHVDSLRLDAVHAIFDRTAISFLQELADAVRREGARLGRNVFTIAESSLNDARLVTPRDAGGMDIDAQWCNDLHHALHTQITPERAGYYADFAGRADLAKACREGFVLDGRYSLYRGRRHGNSARHIDPKRLVVFAQNHDQVGNRPGGDRLAQLASLEELKLAASVILLSPYLPLLFMGEEYAETAPFLFFTSYSDTRVIESVRRGRTEFFSRLGWSGGSADPQAEEAFLRSKLDHSQKLTGHHAILREYYKTLVRIRRHETIFSNSHRDRIEVVDIASASVIAVRQWNAHDELVTIFHFGSEPASATGCIPSGTWEKLVDSAETRWQGPGSTLPPRLESLEQAELLVTPKSAVAFAR
jgi:maltooligosyltrehalose trehalohydrolase